MAEPKTQPTAKSVKAFVDAVENDARRADAKRLLQIFREVTGARPKMWGDSIVGYGSYDYRYASGREGTWLRVGFSPRKQSLSLYLLDGTERHRELLKKLGKHKTAVSCLYINRLEHVDEAVLREIISASWNSQAMGEVPASG